MRHSVAHQNRAERTTPHHTTGHVLVALGSLGAFDVAVFLRLGDAPPPSPRPSCLKGIQNVIRTSSGLRPAKGQPVKTFFRLWWSWCHTYATRKNTHDSFTPPCQLEPLLTNSSYPRLILTLTGTAMRTLRRLHPRTHLWTMRHSQERHSRALRSVPLERRTREQVSCKGQTFFTSFVPFTNFTLSQLPIAPPYPPPKH